MLYANWNLALSAAAESERGKEGNKSLGSYARASEGKKHQDDRVKAMTEDEESVWLGVKDGQLHLFHNVKNWGGVRSRPNHKVGCLWGLGAEAKALIINAECWENPLTLRTPLAKTLFACSSVEEVNNAEPHPTARNASFTTLRASLPPPFILKMMLREGRTHWEADELLLEVIEEAKLFDGEHKEDPSHKDKAGKSLENLVRFLWSVKKGLIDELGTEDTEESDTELTTHWLNCHCRNIEGAIEAERARRTNFPNHERATDPSNSSTNTLSNNPSITKTRNSHVSFVENDPMNEDEMSINSEGETPVFKMGEGLDTQSVNILNSIMKTNKQKPTFSFDNIAPGDGDAALRMSAAMMSHLSESLDHSNKLKVVEIRAQSLRESERKNRVHDFHESFPRMIKNAGGSGTMALVDLPESAKRFFNCKTVGKADQELTAQFEAMGMPMVCVSGTETSSSTTE
jgi:hypothetical protein